MTKINLTCIEKNTTEKKLMKMNTFPHAHRVYAMKNTQES